MTRHKTYYSGASEKRTLWGIKLCPFLRGRPDIGDFLIQSKLRTRAATGDRSFRLCREVVLFRSFCFVLFLIHLLMILLNKYMIINIIMVIK